MEVFKLATVCALVFSASGTTEDPTLIALTVYGRCLAIRDDAQIYRKRECLWVPEFVTCLKTVDLSNEPPLQKHAQELLKEFEDVGALCDKTNENKVKYQTGPKALVDRTRGPEESYNDCWDIEHTALNRSLEFCVWVPEFVKCMNDVKLEHANNHTIRGRVSNALFIKRFGMEKCAETTVLHCLAEREEAKEKNNRDCKWVFDYFKCVDNPLMLFFRELQKLVDMEKKAMAKRYRRCLFAQQQKFRGEVNKCLLKSPLYKRRQNCNNYPIALDCARTIGRQTRQYEAMYWIIPLYNNGLYRSCTNDSMDGFRAKVKDCLETSRQYQPGVFCENYPIQVSCAQVLVDESRQDKHLDHFMRDLNEERSKYNCQGRESYRRQVKDCVAKSPLYKDGHFCNNYPVRVKCASEEANTTSKSTLFAQFLNELDNERAQSHPDCEDKSLNTFRYRVRSCVESSPSFKLGDYCNNYSLKIICSNREARELWEANLLKDFTNKLLDEKAAQKIVCPGDEEDDKISGP